MTGSAKDIIYQALWLFMIYSVIGWMIEVAFHAVTLGKVVNRGFLNGPLCPVYGAGVLSVLGSLPLFGRIFGFDADIAQASPLGLFAIGIVLATLIELTAGFLLDKLFHARWWDYRERKFNLNGYICLEFSIIWGLAIAFVLRVVQPTFAGFVSVIPRVLGITLIVIMYVLFLCDLVITVLTILKFNKQLDRMREMESAIRGLSDNLSEAIGTGTLKTMAKLENGQRRAEERGEELKEAAERMRDELIESAENRKEEIAESVERRIDELEDRKNRLAADYEHLKKSYMYHRLFGTGRLMNSLAPGSHSLYRDILDRIREKQIMSPDDTSD